MDHLFEAGIFMQPRLMDGLSRLYRRQRHENSESAVTIDTGCHVVQCRGGENLAYLKIRQVEIRRFDQRSEPGCMGRSGRGPVERIEPWCFNGYTVGGGRVRLLQGGSTVCGEEKVTGCNGSSSGRIEDFARSV